MRIDVSWVWGAAVLTAATLFCCLNPPFQAPDEPMHLARAACWSGIPGTDNLDDTEALILEMLPRFHFWRFVRFPEPTPTPTHFYNAPLLRLKPSQFAKPGLYYAVNRFLIRILHVSGLLEALYLLRIIGLILTGLTLVFWVLLVREITSDPLVRSLVMSVALVPQYVYMAGAANPATLAWLCASMILYGSVCLHTRRDPVIPLVLVFTGVILSLLSHRSALIVLPAFLASLFLRLTRRYRERQQCHHPGYGLSLSLGVLSVFAWVLTANLHPETIRRLFLRITRITGAIHFQVNDIILSGAWWRRFISLFFRSTFLSFGWLKIDAAPWIYLSLVILIILTVLGLIRRLLRTSPAMDGEPEAGVLLICCFAVFGALGGAGLLLALQGDLSQGRYLFPAWPAFAVLTAAGWSALFPKRWYGLLNIAPLLAWSFYLYALIEKLIIPFYFAF